MDSAAIAIKLEEVHPEPSLRLDTGLHEKIGPILGQAAGPLVPCFMPKSEFIIAQLDSMVVY